MLSIYCKNQWNDYSAGSDHETIEEARECETQHAREGETRTHVVIIPLGEYERLVSK